jgi:hypothetical protein
VEDTRGMRARFSYYFQTNPNWMQDVLVNRDQRLMQQLSTWVTREHADSTAFSTYL